MSKGSWSLWLRAVFASAVALALLMAAPRAAAQGPTLTEQIHNTSADIVGNSFAGSASDFDIAPGDGLAESYAERSGPPEVPFTWFASGASGRTILSAVGVELTRPACCVIGESNANAVSEWVLENDTDQWLTNGMSGVYIPAGEILFMLGPYDPVLGANRGFFDVSVFADGVGQIRFHYRLELVTTNGGFEEVDGSTENVAIELRIRRRWRRLGLHDRGCRLRLSRARCRPVRRAPGHALHAGLRLHELPPRRSRRRLQREARRPAPTAVGSLPDSARARSRAAARLEPRASGLESSYSPTCFASSSRWCAASPNKQLARLRALEVEMGRGLPGEAHAAVDLDVVRGRVEVGLGAVGLRERGGFDEVRLVRRGDEEGVGRGRLRHLDGDEHLGALVLDRLIASRSGGRTGAGVFAYSVAISRHFCAPPTCSAASAAHTKASTRSKFAVWSPLEMRVAGVLAKLDARELAREVERRDRAARQAGRVRVRRASSSRPASLRATTSSTSALVPVEHERLLAVERRRSRPCPCARSVMPARSQRPFGSACATLTIAAPDAIFGKQLLLRDARRRT